MGGNRHTTESTGQPNVCMVTLAIEERKKEKTREEKKIKQC